MNWDISPVLDKWDYQPGQVNVRRFKGRDGVEKLQLRVDLGLLQMNVEGRPDGKRPMGHPSLFEFHRARLLKHVADHEGKDEGFALKSEDCAKLQVETLQYHHRYICLLQLGDFAGAVRDAERNLEVFAFAAKHAENEELAWALQQFQAQALMIHTRARAMQLLDANDHQLAIETVEQGVERLREFAHQHGRSGAGDGTAEIASLEAWLSELRTQRPLTKREQLEHAMAEALRREDYEKAAQVRDELKNLESEKKS
jgi:tetratricopeptide (TPR) repeat protein